MKIQIVYYSKYGSAGEIAHAIGKKLGTDAMSDIRQHKEIVGDLIIIGSAIYSEKPHDEILRLLSDPAGALKDKQVALFAVCVRKTLVRLGEKEGGGPMYVKKMEDALGRRPVASAVFGGRMIPEEMDEQDFSRAEAFTKRMGVGLKSVNVMSENEVDAFVQEIKKRMNLQ